MLSRTENSIVDNVSTETTPMRLLRQLFKQAPDALLVADDQDKIILINARAEQLFGYRSLQLAGQNPRKLLPGWFESLAAISIGSKADSMTVFCNVTNMQAMTKDGIEFSAEVSISALVIGSHRFVVASIREMTPNLLARRALETINRELEETNAQLVSLSKTDPLTELLNRRGLENVLQREVSYAGRNKTELLAVLVDLDDFKAVNDASGHAAGDRVLRRVAQSLKDGLRGVDWIGRVGGDEFLILLPCTALPIGVQVAERVRQSLSETPDSGLPDEHRVTASLGLVSLPMHTTSIEEVLELATAALKESKSRGKNRVSFGDGSTKFLSPDACSLIALLNGNNTCRVIGQPIVRLDDDVTIGYEFLFRGPVGPLEMPEQLFRLSLDNNILTAIDLRCLELCLKQGRFLHTDLLTSINIFPSTLADVPTYRLIDLIQRNRSGGQISLEISERRMVTDPTHLKKQVQELRANGISISLDDIGYGGSILESLFILEPETIKIDGKCISGVADDIEQRRSLSKLARVAKSIGIKTVAKGIETKEDLNVIRHLGIDFGQGWFWGKPS
ncbi:MAG: diguanylate cyclase [Candidatus Obscuribacterales bacterium]|nr:diguanylate cyclase [Candidatus Obscuribacterales bacterium]